MSCNIRPSGSVRQQHNHPDAVPVREENHLLLLSPWPAPRGSTRSYHAMVKPIGSICNLNCSYCYYLHKQDLLGGTNKFRISGEILETHIRQYIEGEDRDEVVFSWQAARRLRRV
jgi:hypothetical protein